MKKIRGFTLIEMMIVVAIIGILASIAYPNYMNYIRKGRRVAARNTLQDIAVQMSNYRVLHNTFKGATIDFSKFNSQFYTYSWTPISKSADSTINTSNNPTTNTYSVTATAIGSQEKDICKSFTLDQTGKQTAEPADKARECWNK